MSDTKSDLPAEAVYRQIRRWLSDLGIELGTQSAGDAPVAPAEAAPD